jgi:hypothetical protein
MFVLDDSGSTAKRYIVPRQRSQPAMIEPTMRSPSVATINASGSCAHSRFEA